MDTKNNNNNNKERFQLLLNEKLFVHIANDNVLLIDKTIKLGADINSISKIGLKPLQCAIIRKSFKAIDYLINAPNFKAIEEVNGTYKGDLIMHFMCEHDKIEQFCQLLNKGANYNIVDNNGQTNVHYCALYNSKKILNHIITNCLMNLNVIDAKGDTPLHIASYNGTLDIVEILTSSKKCDLNIKNLQGKTAIYLACLSYQDSTVDKVVRRLIEKGANVNIKTNDQRSPLITCCALSLHSTIKELLKGNPIIDHSNYSVSTYFKNRDEKTGNLKSTIMETSV